MSPTPSEWIAQLRARRERAKQRARPMNDEERAAASERARAALTARFLAVVDAETPGLSDPERQSRAAELERAHFARLAVRAGQSRRQSKARRARRQSKET